ncbi:PQQ-binding-like beta-propeller repeat protein [Micromonospora sp. NPDC001898]|uniref:outer membrane protein assembly factor BamB family protein n=1 Tax=Micromonospora sp. NPDC001898 TaxID=3364221 RepID=UPI0036AAF470
MTVIDLGELRGDVEPDPPPRPPRAVGRPLRVALAGAVALLALASSAPLVRPASAVMDGRLGREVRIAGGRLYVADPEMPGAGGTRGVTAYANPAGAGSALRPLWRTSAPGGEGLFQVLEHGGFVLITGGGGRDGGMVETVALDAASGRQRWRQPGFPVPTVGGGLLLSGGGDDETADPLRVVDLPSGRPRWSAPVDRGRTAHHYRGAEIDQVVLIPESGRIEVRDAGSGAVLRVGDTRPGGYPSSVFAGDLLLVRANSGVGGDYRVTAYGLDALDRRWELALSANEYLEECGDLLCVGGREAGLSALDPATLRPRWVNPRWQRFVAARGGRLLVAADDRVVAPDLAVLDAATGRTIAELGRWELVLNQGPDEPLFGGRRTREGGLLVAELDPARAVARWLDVLPDVVEDCYSSGRDLLCRRANGTHGWRRLPR